MEGKALFGGEIEFRPVGGTRPQGADKTVPLRGLGATHQATTQTQVPNPGRGKNKHPLHGLELGKAPT